MVTVLSIILALLLYLWPSTNEAAPSLLQLNPLFISIGTLFVFIAAFGNAIKLIPLQKAEENSTPRLIELFSRDFQIAFSTVFLLFFSLVSFFYAFHPSFFNNFHPSSLFAIWLVLFGISTDLLLLSTFRTLSYLNPFSSIKIFTREAKKSIQAERDNELCDWIDSLTEISNKAISRNSIGLCNNSIDEMQQIAQIFMETCKSIGHISTEKGDVSPATRKNSDALLGRDADEVSYILFYMFQRLEFINDRAIQKKLEPISTNIITVLSKIAIYAAKFDLSLTGYPVFFIGKLTKKAQENGENEVGIKATFALLEIAKTIVNEIPFTSQSDLRNPFSSIISNLNEIVKTAFKMDKSISIQVLMQPFVDLKELLKNEKIAAHQDTPAILAQIDSVLGEYEALDQVMKTMPAFPMGPES